MIPADGTHYVHFRLPDGNPGLPSPVVAWDEDGSPLVVGKWGLVRASDAGRGAVARIKRDNEPVVGAVPGGGWLIDCTDDEGNTWTTPILAWTVHADATTTPLTSDSDGLTGDATEGLSSYRIYHPAMTDVQSSE
jgi:hypothetical protein